MSRQMRHILRYSVKSGSMTKPTDLSIGNRIKEARKAAGLTQAELGDKIGRTQGIINKIEVGEVAVTLENLYNLSDALGRPVAYFLDLDVGDLNQDEAEIVDMWRALPDGMPKQYGKNLLRSWLDQILGRA